MTENPPGDYTHSLPAKRMAVGALFFNPNGEILIVKPTYREGWLIPGGVIEQDESPYRGCLREIHEELGLDLPVYRLLCMEYRAVHGASSESLQFLFYGGVLDEAVIFSISLPPQELSGCQFCSPSEALALLIPALSGRIKYGLLALEQQRFIYLEDQVEISMQG